MFGKTTKSKLIFIAALIFGGIGAFGQAMLLHHELVDCLPYKVVDYHLYRGIAEIGVYLAPALSIVGGFLFGLKRFWLATIIPVISCPLLFAVVFSAASAMRKLNDGVGAMTGGFTSTAAAQRFYPYIISLAATGLLIAAICSLLLLWLSKDRKLL